MGVCWGLWLPGGLWAPTPKAMCLLNYLLEHGLADTKKIAKSLIMRGDVLIDNQPVTSPAAKVGTGVVRIRGGSGTTSDVSRGAKKIRPVTKQLDFDCSGHTCLDLGAADRSRRSSCRRRPFNSLNRASDAEPKAHRQPLGSLIVDGASIERHPVLTEDAGYNACHHLTP